MALLQEILKWSEQLPHWQSDAIARLLTKQNLSSDDIDDLLALLKAEHGIPDVKGRTPKKLTADQIPVPAADSTHIELLAVKNMHHVNAIAEHRCLPIGKAGLTLVYGDNGSGKSGYSRVLKHACRSRDQNEPIHPNAYLPADKVGIPEADFEILVNDVAKELHWVDGKTAPAELSSFAIFDSRCARAYLDTEDNYSYVPYGLDVFEGLAKICNQLKTRLEAENVQAIPDLTPFTPLQGDTAVGRLIASLSARTTTGQVETLATLNQEELARYIQLGKSLNENNPAEKALQLRTCARRIAAIAAAVATKGAIVDNTAIGKLRELANDYRTALEAAVLAAQQFKETENLLPGTGGEAWRELFEAARRYAIESHPGKTFPDLGADALCPLCQQPLAESATRLLQFEAFVQQETEKTVQSKSSALDTQYVLFAAQDITLNLDDITFGEIEALDSQLAIDTRLFEGALKARHEAVKAAIKSNQWESISEPLLNPAVRLKSLTDKLNSEALLLESAADGKVRAELHKKYSELDLRNRLAQVKDAVLTAVAKLSHQAKLKDCLSAVKTNAISLKSSELAEKVVSKELAEALNREFKTLGVGSLSVSLASRADRGKALHKLKLDLPQSRSPTDILSEGEQRVIAIGSFLAEVGLSAGKAGIVLDDPVSSLDHRHRERVARRLVAEAALRQVIIFSHDIYFLCILAEEAEAQRVPITTQSLVRQAEGFGISDPDLPFEGKNVSKRIGALKAQQQIILKLLKDGNEPEFRQQTIDAYFHLRMTWERAVEEVLLRKVVLRFRKGIETQRLAEVVVNDEDYAVVDAGMTKCSNYAHDKATSGGIAVPDPDELLADIQILEDWRSKVETRSKDISKSRKAKV